MKRRYRSNSVDVTIDVSEVVDQIDTEDLEAELQARRGATAFIDGDWLDRIQWILQRGDTHSALAMVESVLPRFRLAAARAVDAMPPSKSTH